MVYRIDPDKSDLQNMELVNNVFFEIKTHFENISSKDFIQSITDMNTIWLKHLVDIPIIVFINTKNKCIWVNNIIKKTLGFTPQEWMDMTSEERLNKYHPDDIPGLKKVCSAEHFKHNICHFECRIKDKSNNWRWIYTTNFPTIYTKDRQISIQICAAVDITQIVLKESEIESLNSELNPSLERERKYYKELEDQFKKELNNKENQLSELAKSLNQSDAYLFKIRNILEQGKALTDKNINISLQNKNDWLKLEQEFFDNNPMFMNKLSSEFCNLTNMEIRVCAMIKLNMRSKEIADILNICQKTVDNHRLNIRRKLNLEDHTQLSTFLMKF